MKLSDQVCSLDQAKKLVELGLVFPPIWRWCGDEDGYYLSESQLGDLKCPDHFIPSYTVAELGLLIPHRYLIGVFKEQNEWCCITGKKENYFKKEADARAHLLIYLLESRRLKAEDLKL